GTGGPATIGADRLHHVGAERDAHPDVEDRVHERPTTVRLRRLHQGSTEADKNNFTSLEAMARHGHSTAMVDAPGRKTNAHATRGRRQHAKKRLGGTSTASPLNTDHRGAIG